MYNNNQRLIRERIMRKIILAQTDNIPGDIEYNFNKIENNIVEAKKINADLIIFSSSALFGSPCKGLPVRHKSLVKYQSEKLNEIAKLSDNIALITGFLNSDNNYAVAFINNGEIVKTVSVPDIIELNNNKYGIICGEYDENNSDEIINDLKDKGVETIIHCSSSPSRNGKEFLLNGLLSSIAKKYSVNYIFVNQSGYGDNYSFAGSSRIYDKSGNIIARGKSFEEDFIVTEDLKGKIEELPFGEENNEQKEFSLNYENDLERTYKALICGIKGYFNKTGFKKAVLGLSGGLDSSVCAALLVSALGKENVYGISMPTKITSDGSKQDAQQLVQNLGIHFLEVPILAETEVFTNELNKVFEKIDADKYVKSTTFENIQARTRATLLWSISNEYKAMLPIATSDKSEAYIGYATTNGNMSGGFAPIGDVTKTKLFALANYINTKTELKNAIPQNVLEKPPGAELKFDKEKGRTITAEEDNMPYPFLDEIIWYVENKNYGFEELMNREFLYQKENPISCEQKRNWILKFFDKSQKAVFKWHILPLSIIVDCHSINGMEYYQPVLSKQSFDRR